MQQPRSGQKGQLCNFGIFFVFFKSEKLILIDKGGQTSGKSKCCPPVLVSLNP